mmetsp:Transcript_23639/g.44651  ORF Transcript_23639/g.44651 Transcript_23639/m.44651 type:complete len:118 (-) Transcript_23639:339-692(-)
MPYPVPLHKQYASNAVFIVQLAIWAVVFMGDAIFDAIKVPKPDLLASVQGNKMMAFMGVWLVGNMISAQLLNTGAFEIHHGDELIWSSLEMQRLPNMADLLQAFAKTGVEFIQRSET